MATALDQLEAAATSRAATTERANVDYRLESLILDPVNRSIPSIDLAEVVNQAELELTLEEASTLALTISDRDTTMSLLESDFFTGWAWGTDPLNRDEKTWLRKGRAIDVLLDDVWFRLVAVRKTGAGVELVFEDRVAAMMRARTGYRKVYRDKITRPKFVALLAVDAGVPFAIPTSFTEAPTQRRTQLQTDPDGITPGLHLQQWDGSTHRLTKQETRNAGLAMKAARDTKAPLKATQALLCACIVEAPMFANPVGGEGTSSGILQLTGGKLGGSTSTKGGRRDVYKVCRLFLESGFYNHGGAIDQARREPNKTPGRIAQDTQGSAHPDRYQKVLPAAEKVLRGSFLGPDKQTVVEEEERVPLERERGEDSWDCSKRLGDERNIRSFARSGYFQWVSEEMLLSFAPKLKLEYKPGDGWQNGVEDIDFDIDSGARDLVAELTVTAWADRWTALHGHRVDIEGLDIIEGKWLVSSVRPDLFGIAPATITLRRAMPEKPEPRGNLIERESPKAERKTGGDSPARFSTGSTPKDIIDQVVLPIARECGFNVTAASVAAANARHTHLGSASDHAGPPSLKWAVDLGIGPDIRGGGNPAGAARGDKVAKALSEAFNVPASGLHSHNSRGFRFQLIWRYEDAQAGNHYTHVHFGVRKA